MSIARPRRARDSDSVPALARALFLDRAFILIPVLARARVRDWADVLAADDALAEALGLAIGRAIGRALVRALAAPRRPGRVTASASRLLTAAARLLPAADRARYAEEFRSELWELARAGEPRRRQIGYAARQAASSLRLRAELRAPRRRKASP
jgi:hypothetical protein